MELNDAADLQTNHSWIMMACQTNLPNGGGAWSIGVVNWIEETCPEPALEIACTFTRYVVASNKLPTLNEK